MAGVFAFSVSFSAASALIDLAMAFEHIQFSDLWRMGVQDSFPLRLLRFLIGVSRRDKVPAGGERGDEGGTLGRLCS